MDAIFYKELIINFRSKCRKKQRKKEKEKKKQAVEALYYIIFRSGRP